MTTANAGLGISGFLKHTGDSGSRGQWLRQWRKDNVGEVTIWLHTRAPIVPSFSHQFMIEDEFEDKEVAGRMVPVLRYPRFASPDAESVHRNQYFRNDDGTLQMPPDRDPFLLLREWLRFNAEHIGLEEPVFKWSDEKNRKIIVWNRGEISGLVKRAKLNFSNSLDTKTEYVYVVVDNDNIDTGPVLAREGKLVSQKIVAVIKQQVKQWGDEDGDPMRHPYAFKLVAQKSVSPMNMYEAYKDERAQFSDEVWAQIASDEYPDPLPFGQPADGDMEKIRDAFERAAQVELPLDQIFSEDSETRRALTRPSGGNHSPPRASKAAQSRTVGQVPPVPTKPAAVVAKPAQQPAAAVAAPAPAASAGAPQMRRKKVEKPAEPPPPEVEMIPCEDCGIQMKATDTKCPGCGAEYEPVEEDPRPEPSAKPAPTVGPKPTSNAKPATASQPKPAAASAKPQAATTAAAGVGDALNCWACGQPHGGQKICPSCGIDQGDEIPF